MLAFRWRADNDPLAVVFGSSLPSVAKRTVKVGPPLKKLSGPAHGVSNVNESQISDGV